MRLALVLAGLAALGPAAGSPQEPAPSPDTSLALPHPREAVPSPQAPRQARPLAGEIPPVDAVVSVRDFGQFRVRLLPAEAPHHVACFLALAARGYFDGMSFHRVIPGFLIQTGDPASRDDDPSNDGLRAPPWRIPPEATGRTHRRGTVSMAWQGEDPGSAASQWFVTLADLPQLDGCATVIGEVVEGMDTVDRIAQVSTHRNRRPLRRVALESVRLVGRAPPASSPSSGEAQP